jgi:CHAT domain-containing protein
VISFVARPGTTETLRSVVTPVEPGYLDQLLGGLRFQLSRALMLPERAGDDRLVAGFDRVSAALYDLLLRPVEPLVPDGAHVVISPHAGLHAGPYAALWDGAHYAGERWTFSVLPNLSMTARLVDLPPRPGAPLIVGVWDEQAPRIATEVAAVGAELPMATTLLGEAATVAGVSRAVGRASDIHVACHGHFSARAPRSAGLRMTDGWLTVGAIQRLQMWGAHVTLSGCDTGAATHSALDDAIGVPAALLNAGVASMLVSHWPAHDDASTLLMTAWYRARGTRAAPARALAAAQSETRQHFPHPALWSAFYVGGIG